MQIEHLFLFPKIAARSRSQERETKKDNVKWEGEKNEHKFKIIVKTIWQFSDSLRTLRHWLSSFNAVCIWFGFMLLCMLIFHFCSISIPVLGMLMMMMAANEIWLYKNCEAWNWDEFTKGIILWRKTVVWKIVGAFLYNVIVVFPFFIAVFMLQFLQVIKFSPTSSSIELLVPCSQSPVCFLAPCNLKLIFDLLIFFNFPFYRWN